MKVGGHWAWAGAYEASHDARYLQMAEVIFAVIANGWDDGCAGGIWWKKDRHYKNAIANEWSYPPPLSWRTWSVTRIGGPCTRTGRSGMPVVCRVGNDQFSKPGEPRTGFRMPQ
jgi:hypothetical protein